MECIKRGTTSQRGELSNANHEIGSMSISKGESIDAYKEKVEHFKVLVMHLQNELQANKMRKEGAETVSKLLQESKKEVMHLQRKVKTLESAIRNLQSRLELHGLSTEITLQEGETYIPSHSKQLLDNLTRENTRLRALIRTASGDPEEFDRLQKEIQSLNSRNNEAELQQEDLTSKIRELEDVLKASDNDKDATIKRLRDELALANQELSRRGYECLSLSEEKTTLQNQLREVAQKCQELAQKLERHRAGAQSPVETEIKQTRSPDSDEMLARVQEENTLLKAKVKEITEMNKRWQEYNQQRDQIVTQLHADLKDKEKLQDAKVANVERAMQEQLHRILEDAQTNVNRATQEAAKAKQESAQYKQRFDEANRKLAQMAEQLTQLQRKVQAPVTEGAEAEIIEALKQQIQICTEDFESERKDREKVQSKLHRALSENEHLKKEVENLKKERIVTTPQVQDQRQYNDPFYHYQLPGPHGNFGGESLAARGVSTNNAKNMQYYNKDRYNVIDGVSTDFQSDSCAPNITGASEVEEQTQVVSINSNKDSSEHFCSLKSLSSFSDQSKSSEHKVKSLSPRGSTASPKDLSPRNSGVSLPVNSDGRTRTSVDILKCPKCDKEYSSDEHADLLEHIEICCE